MNSSKFPDSQPFNVSPKPNKAKKNSWWNNEPYHNNQVKRGSK